jgi:uncharacterized protein (DUF983 family)
MRCPECNKQQALDFKWGLNRVVLRCVECGSGFKPNKKNSNRAFVAILFFVLGLISAVIRLDSSFTTGDYFWLTTLVMLLGFIALICCFVKGLEATGEKVG